MTDPSRRAFLRLVAGSTLLAIRGLPACRPRTPGAGLPADLLGELAARIASPDEAINFFDFQTVAGAVLPPAHYGRFFIRRPVPQSNRRDCRDPGSLVGAQIVDGNQLADRR